MVAYNGALPHYYTTPQAHALHALHAQQAAAQYALYQQQMQQYPFYQEVTSGNIGSIEEIDLLYYLILGPFCQYSRLTNRF